MKTHNDPPLIPRDILFGNPSVTSMQISPDGQYISYLAPLKGVLNIWVQQIDTSASRIFDPTKAIPLTQDSHRGIHTYQWMPDSSSLLYLQDQGGDENWQLYKTDLKGAFSQLTFTPHTQVRIMKTSPLLPHQVLIGMNKRNPEYHDLYLLDTKTSDQTLIFENDHYVDFLADEHLEPRLGGYAASNGDLVYDLLEGEGVTPFWRAPLETEEAAATAAISISNDKLYMTSSREDDTAALVEVDIKTNGIKVLAHDPQADIQSVFLDPLTQKPWAALSHYDKPKWYAVDEAFAPHLRWAQKQANGDYVGIQSSSLDGSRLIITFESPSHPPHYYLYDRQKQHLWFLLSAMPALEAYDLAPMQPVHIKARDGLDLVGFLTLPQKKTGPGPLILLVHGGPWEQDRYKMSPLDQFFANRGYAVLRVNYRGSTGYGKNFIRASHGEWAGAMHQDILDATRWAIHQGIAEKGKIVIAGGSYGGYEALVALTQSPDVFAGGINIVGISNLKTLMASFPPYWKPILSSAARRILGMSLDDPAAETKIKSISPLTYVQQIKKPLLMGHGANDPRVKQAESDQIANEMKLKNIPLTYVVYTDEGHGFKRPENNIYFWGLAEAFLAQILGGRAEPLDETTNTSATIVNDDFNLKGPRT